MTFRGERAQASVETVAIAPIILLCCLLGFQGLIAGANFVAAGNAAHAGALAGQLGRDPVSAARAAAPGWSSTRMKVARHGRRVRVELSPRTIVPGLAAALKVTTEARWVAR